MCINNINTLFTLNFDPSQCSITPFFFFLQSTEKDFENKINFRSSELMQRLHAGQNALGRDIIAIHSFSPCLSWSEVAATTKYS